MSKQFVQDEAPEYELFALDKLQLHKQLIQDEALEHEFFEGKLQMQVQMPRQFF
jgi:hypothetical protein